MDRKSIKTGSFESAQAAFVMDAPIYLDYNGTTPCLPEVVAAMQPYWEKGFGNPSSSHYYGWMPRQAVITARQQVAGLLNCHPDEIIFTSGGTESNNQALKGLAAARFDRGNHIITSRIEHPAVLEVCRFLDRHGYETTYLPVDEKGRVALSTVAEAITPRTILITIMQANNEVGTLQPIAEIAELARSRNIVLHTDAAQAAGKIPTDVQALGVDLLSLAGHKLYAPKGVGALYVRRGLWPEVFCHGAGQENGRRAGTENVPGIVGLGLACQIAREHLPTFSRDLQTTRDQLEAGLLKAIPGARVNGHLQQRLPNTASIALPGWTADDLLAELGDKVAVSAGSACHSGTPTISHVLAAMGLPADRAQGTLRFSTGRMTTADQIEKTIALLVEAVGRAPAGQGT